MPLNPVVTVSRQRALSFGFTAKPFTGYMLALAVSYTLLNALSGLPLGAVLCADLVLCGFIAGLFPGIRYRWLVFLYPVLVFLISQSFTGSWFDAGDGLAYTPAAEKVYSHGFFAVAQSIMDSYGTASIFRVAKVMSPGASLGYVLAFHLFDLSTDPRVQDVFVASQGFVFLCLVGLIATIVRKWQLLDERFAFSFIAFLLISPTVLEFNAVPSRHLVTLAGLSLLCVTHFALLQKIAASRIAFYALAIVIVVMSKAPLLLPYLAFVYLSTRRFLSRSSIFIFALLAFAAIFVFPDSFSYYGTIFGAYDNFRTMGMATFGSDIMEIPVIGWAVKYLYALLSPFPWFKYEHFVSTNYAGSYLLFVIHMLSSLTGLYFFSVLILRWKRILNLFRTDFQFRVFIVFGLVMSTSIIAGAPGFHTYLSIYFPFFAPLLIYKGLRVNYMIPIAFAFVANMAAAMVG